MEKMTREILFERQSWPLHQKIDHSLGVIDQFCSRMNGQVYVSFSGGKDSTVLLDLCRVIKPDIKAVFCNTGLEYPDIVRFVRELGGLPDYNIEVIHPDQKPKEIIDKFGFPLISKETSKIINNLRNNPNGVVARRARGEVEHVWKSSKLPRKYEFLVNEAFNTSEQCCYYLKKKPFRQYQKRTGLYPILGNMAAESQLRQSAYIRRGGCNSFQGKIESAPLSIWTETDVWGYIKERNLQIAEIYHRGATRTGCMCCGYGCQMKGDNRFQMLKELYPKFYTMLLGYKNHGVTYEEAINKVLEANGIKPLEKIIEK